MTKFGTSQSVARREDDRFLTGAGRYMADISLEACAVRFLRSPVAHAAITSLDVAAARDMPGVLAVITAADLAGKLDNALEYSRVKNRDGSQGAGPVRPILAGERVRFMGECIAAVVAETAAQADEALEAIELDFEELPAKLDLAVGGPPIHDEAEDNRVFDWAFGDEDAVDAAFDAAAHTTGIDMVDNRVMVVSLEGRGCRADWDGTRLTFAYGGQGVWGMRDQLVAKLGLAEGSVTVQTPDVGGGFGMKGFPYPEYFVTALAAKETGRPCAWLSDRSEAMLSDNGGRDLMTRAEAAWDADHKMTALRIVSVANMGAHCSAFAQYIQTELALKVLTGVYDVQTVHFSCEGIFTNTTPLDAYRGAGRPEAIYKLERLMDASARQLGVDPVALRRKNFIPADRFPYRSASGELYDVGDFNRVLDRALAEADVPGFAARKAESAAAGKLRGLGMTYYIESILGAPTEGTTLAWAEDGAIEILVGTQSTGQGHETVYAQFLHERAGVPFDRIRVVQGDSDRIASGGGTGGSRSVTVQGSSILATADVMLERFKPLAEEELEVAAADLVFEAGSFRVAGTDRAVELVKLAEVARERAPELLVTEGSATLPGRSYPNGCHIAEVEVDRETGKVDVVRYTVTDDFGYLVNPMLAEGQVHGGVAQGIGQAIQEHVVFDEEGQLLTGSLMDYSMPRAADLPMMPFHAELVPSTANVIGMKGCGEAGTVGAMAAVTNAVLDAVWEAGVRHVDMPMTPSRVWSWLAAAQSPMAAE